MYIPITFFGSQGSCFTTTTSTIAGDGIITTGSFISGGFVWDYYQFEMSDKENANLTSFTASLNVLTGSTGQAKVLIVGGGGTGAKVGLVNNIYEVVTTGGGGAGGVVYYNQFPISSGSYTIGIGKATSGPGGFVSPGTTGDVCGKLGEPTWLRLPNNNTYSPFDSSYLIAYGGGGANVQGSYATVTPRRVFIADFGGQNTTSSLLLGNLVNASGGGGGNVISSTLTGGTPGASGGNLPGGVDMGGLNGADQGNKGGTGLGGANINGFCIDGTGVGGGGAGAAGEDRQLTAGGTPGSGGGIGLQFNLTGTPTYFAGGGGGRATTASGATGRGLGSYGCGGNGSLYGSNMNGQAGVVIIAIPRCESSFSCRQFAITGSGATATFLECGKTTSTSTTLANNFDIVACLKTYSGSITPLVATGATYVALSASCDAPFTSSNNGCTNCNTYAVTSDSNKIAKVDYTPCNQTTPTTTYIAGTFNLCVSGSGISVATGSASSLGTNCSVIGCDTTPSNTNTPPCPCQFLFVNVFNGIYEFDYTDCNGVTQRRTSSSFQFCGVPGSIRNGSCVAGSCIGLNIRQGGDCCTFP